MAAPPSPTVYLRNVVLWSVAIPLGPGLSRVLTPADTTRVGLSIGRSPAVMAALTAGVLVIPLLPPPAGRSLRLPKGAGLRSPVSASARQFLACAVDLERQVQDRMAQERALEAARVIERERRRPWLQAHVERGEWRWSKGQARARIFYSALRQAAVEAALPPRLLFATLDGDRPLPAPLAARLNGAAILPRKAKEAGADRDRAAIDRYTRRTFMAARLVRASQGAAGIAGINAAAKWLAGELAEAMV